MVAFDNGVVAIAVQTSAVPACELARSTRVHDTPPPDTVTDWSSDSGPSDATNATRTSPDPDVLNVVPTSPLLPTVTIPSRTGPRDAAASSIVISTAAKFH